MKVTSLLKFLFYIKISTSLTIRRTPKSQKLGVNPGAREG